MDVDLEGLQISRKEEFVPITGKRGFNWWIILFFLALAAGAGSVWYVQKAAKAREGVAIKTKQIFRRGSALIQATASFSSSGWIKLPNYYPKYVTPLTIGRVERFLVIEGDRVEVGQIVATLYDENYRLDLARAEAEVQLVNANYMKLKAGFRIQEVSQAKAEVDRLEAEVLLARIIYEDSLKLKGTGSISEEEEVIDKSKYDALSAGLVKAKEQHSLLSEGFRIEDIAVAKANLDIKIAIRDDKKLLLEYCVVKSPYAGIVLERKASEGQYVGVGPGVDVGPILNIYDPKDIEARIDIDQDDMTKVSLGQQVEVKTRAEPGHIHMGRVILIEPMTDQVKMTANIKVKFDHPGVGILYPDMTVSARFLPPKKKGPKVPTVPTEKQLPLLKAKAILHDGGSKFVFVIYGGKAHKVKIVIGDLIADEYEVKEGLRGGERVAITKVEELSDGCKVKLEK